MKIKNFFILILRFFIWPIYCLRELLIEDDNGLFYDRLIAGFLSVEMTCPILLFFIRIDYGVNFWLLLKIGVVAHLIFGLSLHLIIKGEFGESFLF